MMVLRCLSHLLVPLLATAGLASGATGQPTSSAVPAKLQLPVDKLVVILGIVLVGAATVLWVKFLQSHSLKSLPRRRLKNMHNGRFDYDTLTPMVLEVLRDYGALLWGRNMPWSTNYHVYERRRRWILSEARHDRAGRSLTKIEIGHKSACFKVRISRLDGIDVDLFLFSRELSEGALREGLQKICIHLAKGPDVAASEQADPAPDADT